MNERDRAIALADNILDRPNADPDDDLAVLARQLLRAREHIDRFEVAAYLLFEHSLMKQMEGAQQPTQGSLWYRLEALRLVLVESKT